MSILRFDCAAVLFDDRANNGQAHAEAFFFGGEELFEKTFACSRSDSVAVIAHVYANGAAILTLRGDSTRRFAGGVSCMASKALLIRLIKTC